MAADPSPALWWVRRDLRLADNPALRAAIDEGGDVPPLFVLVSGTATSGIELRRTGSPYPVAPAR